MKRQLALVVPSLHQGGGVRAVARFLRDVAARDGAWHVRPISLCMSSADPESVSLRNPATWLRGVQVGCREWGGLSVPHVGAKFGELEFQRYAPRRGVAALLAGCDVVQVVCGSPAWANVVTGLGRPVSLQVATLARVERRMRERNRVGMVDSWRRMMTRITDTLDERALRKVDAIQVENPWMLKHAQRANLDRSGVDIRYAPPGVDATVFHPLPLREWARGSYVLCVGRLDDPRKNIGLLLEAYARLPQLLLDDFELVLAGTAGPPPTFWARAEALGVRPRIRYVARPSQSDLVRLYQQAAVFALPSDEEGLGVVVLEAMACGVPPVCTLSGGPDGIITDGKDGFLTPLDDATTLADRIQCLLEDKERNLAMGFGARSTIEERYSNDMAGAAFLDVWDRLLHDRNTRNRRA